MKKIYKILHLIQWSRSFVILTPVQRSKLMKDIYRLLGVDEPIYYLILWGIELRSHVLESIVELYEKKHNMWGRKVTFKMPKSSFNGPYMNIKLPRYWYRAR